MSKPQDGGPAFPREDYQADDAPGQRGMSLRDYFAAKALAGIIAAYTGQDTPLPAIGMATAYAYDYADGMLKERAK